MLGKNAVTTNEKNIEVEQDLVRSTGNVNVAKLIRTRCKSSESTSASVCFKSTSYMESARQPTTDSYTQKRK